MTERAKIIEVMARGILRGHGVETHASDEGWPDTLAHYRRMEAKHGESYTSARNLVTDSFRNATFALTAYESHLQASGMAVVDGGAPVFSFLMGEGPLDGRGFGDDPPVINGRKHHYWWRKHLRAVLTASPDWKSERPPASAKGVARSEQNPPEGAE